MGLDQKTDLAFRRGDQGIEGLSRDVDHCLAVGALQMRMCGSGLRARCWHGQVVDSRRASDVGVRDQSKITECGQSAIDRCAMDSGG